MKLFLGNLNSYSFVVHTDILFFFTYKDQKENLKYVFFRHDILPIAMGARPEDYARAAPHKSFIHVDHFNGPKAGWPDVIIKISQVCIYNEFAYET